MLKQTGGHSTTGSLKQIWQMHALDGSTKKAKQAAKTGAAAMTRGTHVTHATLAAQTAWASQLAVPGTPSPLKQSKHKGRQQQISSWWIPHTQKQMWVVMLSRSRSRARAVPQNFWRKIWMSILIGMMRSKMLSCQF